MFKQTDIRKARRHLRSADPVMKAIIDAVGPFTLGLERNRLRMLVCSIISQQISGSAAASIFGRLRKLAGPGGLNAANLARYSITELRSVGLSPQKASYVTDLVKKVNDETINLRQIGRLSDEQVIERLVLVKGIGRWTAQMFVIFSLGRLDVFPHDDLGVGRPFGTTMALPIYQTKKRPSKSPNRGHPMPRWRVGIAGNCWIWSRGRAAQWEMMIGGNCSARSAIN